jgi:alginate O-acetyltransferase complex protein AlgI
MLVVYFGWALFRQESIADLGTSLKGMFGLNGNGFMDMATSIQIKNNIFLLIFCIIASTPLIKYIGRFFRGLVSRIPYPVYVYEMIAPIALLILSFMALIGNSYNPFLYFQF